MSFTAKVFLCLLASLTLYVPLARNATAADVFDVSYVWASNQAAVKEYREQVARILGPAVDKDLRLVSDGDLLGVIYRRQGDISGAVRVARAHSRLLVEQGLEPAAPVLSKDWIITNEAQAENETGPEPAIAKRPNPPAPSVNPNRGAGKTDEALDLETAVEAYIKNLRREGRIGEDERTGWSVYDFTTGRKLVTINEEVQFQAASLIKPFIAAAFFHRVEQGDLVYGPKSRRQMERMIQYSSNRATNWVMRQVGGPQAVQRILQGNYPGIFGATHIVEYIPAGGRTYRNKASAHDYSRFLYAIWNNKIAGAQEIKRLMALPGPDRIFTGAEEVPSGTRVFNKTGSTARLCADIGILSVEGPDGKRYPYTLIGIIEKQNKARNFSAWIHSRGEVIRDVSDIVYRGIARRHAFGDMLKVSKSDF